MQITLHNESINIEVGQKITFYNYKLNKGIQLEVIPEETYVDVIDEKNNIVGFKNDTHSCTLSFYQNDTFGERFFLSDTKENRLRYLHSMEQFYDKLLKKYIAGIKESYELIQQYKKSKFAVISDLSRIRGLISEEAHL